MLVGLAPIARALTIGLVTGVLATNGASCAFGSALPASLQNSELGLPSACGLLVSRQLY